MKRHGRQPFKLICSCTRHSKTQRTYILKYVFHDGNANSGRTVRDCKKYLYRECTCVMLVAALVCNGVTTTQSADTRVTYVSSAFIPVFFPNRQTLLPADYLTIVLTLVFTIFLYIHKVNIHRYSICRYRRTDDSYLFLQKKKNAL